MGYSPWGCKESGMIERLSTAQHSLSYSTRDLQFLLQHVGSLVAACRLLVGHVDQPSWLVQFLDQGLNPGPLHWDLGVLTTGSPGKSPDKSSSKTESLVAGLHPPQKKISII